MMKRLRFITLLTTVLAFALSCVAGADDGAITNKSMSKNINVPIFDQSVVNEQVSEAEHAFTDFMKFYVPAQKASGELLADTEDGGIVYCDIDGQLVQDNEPNNEEDKECLNDPVETLGVAKPLVNVFIYGPQFEVEGTAFGHSFFDTYAAVSLDDGETWKKTNLSESADKSSFDLEEDHKPSKKDPLPNDHTILFGSKNNGAWHARGYDTPYTAHCSECHGSALQGTAQTPSCYSCHGSNKWEEPTPIELGPIVTSAIFKNGKILVVGENALSKIEVTLINGETGHELGTTDATYTGTFDFNLKTEVPPCTVSAFYTDSGQVREDGPAISVLDKDGIPVEECEGHTVDLNEYPGGTYNVFRAVAGNKVLVAWPSRFCGSGQPAYSLTTDNDDDENGIPVAEKVATANAIADFIRAGDSELGVPALPNFTSPFDAEGNLNLAVDDLYLFDAFGVAGSQGSVDFADEGYPQAGVVPFGCVWTARGVMLPGDDPRTEDFEEASYMVWTKAERLTSGRRDPNRIEVHAVQGAGFVITWQEDPEGLRPGQGLGPGEGWSGAVAHAQTDAWYSFINEEYFDIVKTAYEDDEGKVAYTLDPIDILDHDLTMSGRPQVFVPMAVPMRLSNNAKCNPYDMETSGTGTPPVYCVFEPHDDYDIPIGAQNFGLRDQCAATVEILTGNEEQDKDKLSDICVADSFDGIAGADLPNRANTALTRPRTSLQVYSPSDDEKSAWVVVIGEESKGLGKFFFRADADGDGYADQCTELESEEDPTCTEEIGKNIWYFSFDMGTPDTSAGTDNPNSLINNLVNQGNMLNQAEVYWGTGELLGLMDTATMADDGGGLYDDEEGDYNFEIANTEIARRGSLLVQGISKAVAGDSGLVAMPSWKQGVMRQGGPADTMLRRIVLPGDFDPAVDNPYAFDNMVCDEWLIDPDTNPYYPGGLCADPAINLSGVVVDTCLDDETGTPVDCPTVDTTTGSTYGISDTVPVLQGYIKQEGNKTRVLTWHQCPSVHTIASKSDDIEPVACGTPDWFGYVNDNNLDDQSWYNPLDVSKGHRGFLDGDFAMFLYAWSPNWRLNTKGHDRYELYVRRSFDGGVTWGTTPSNFTAGDGVTYSVGNGTVTCESYRKTETGTGDAEEPIACYEFAAGAAEHARNVTQHKSMKITTLDPRYASTGSPRGVGIDPLTCTAGLFVDSAVIDGVFTCDDTSEVQDTDLRNPSRYFMVFETGDNKTVEAGEAEPLDLYYSRAETFGDDYVVWTETDTGYDTDLVNTCFPSVNYGEVLLNDDPRIGSGFCNEFNRMNTGGDSHSSEASLSGNSDGSKMYGVTGQWVFEDDDDYESEISESDAMARRVWWIDNYRSDNLDLIYTLPGTQNE